MPNSFLDHLKAHPKTYGIGLIVVAFVASAIAYNQVPNFESLSASLTGDITSAERADSSLQIVSPNGGETFVSGDVTTIRWADEDGAERYHLYLLPSESNQDRTNKDEKVIVKNVRGLDYEWRIPIYVKGQFKIGIENDSSDLDTSDNYFKVIRN